MTDFFAWKYINEEQVLTLEEYQDYVPIKNLLREYFQIHKLHEKKQQTAVDYHFHNYAFCKKSAFDVIKTSTFLSIMNEVLLRDAASSSLTNNAEKSFTFLQELVLKHSVERPPKSMQVFLPHDVEPILNYALDCYFRNFDLYLYIFGVQTKVVIQQINFGNVESPNLSIPLNDSHEISKPITMSSMI